MKINFVDIPADTKSMPVLNYKKINMKSVEVKSPPSPRVIHRLCKTCLEHDGLGLAAPQVGIFDRIFVTRTFDSPENEPSFWVYINPTWKAIADQGKSSQEEGCLSVPGLGFSVNRWEAIEASWVEWDLHGPTKITRVLSGIEARVFQHEHQHLSGISIVDVGISQKSCDADTKSSASH